MHGRFPLSVSCLHAKYARRWLEPVNQEQIKRNSQTKKKLCVSVSTITKMIYKADNQRTFTDGKLDSMRLDCSILLKQAHVIKYHNPDMWHDNTAAVKAWGSLVKGTFTRDVLHSLFVILVRLSFLWILANRKLQIGLYTLYCWKKLHNNYNTWGCGVFWWTVTTALFIHSLLR